MTVAMKTFEERARNAATQAVAQTYLSAVSPTFQSAGNGPSQQARKPAIRKTGKSGMCALRPCRAAVSFDLLGHVC
jgi:hypothetical protein